MQSDSNLGGGAAGGESGGLGSSGAGLGGTGTGSTGAGGLSGTGSTGTGGLSGTSGAGTTGSGLGGTTGGSTGGGLSGAGSTGGGLSGAGSAGSTGAGFTEGGVFTTGEDFEAHDGYYRRHYAVRPETTTPTVTTYEDARTGYEAGHRAAANPVYASRPYEEVEVELEKEYPDKSRFAAVRGYARHAFGWKTLLGAVALAGGAYWVSRKAGQAAAEISEEEERDCRTYYDTHPVRGTVPYEQARTVYVLGYVAGRNPDYSGRTYDDVEPHLRSGFTSSRAGSYDSLRDFTRRGYERGSSRGTL